MSSTSVVSSPLETERRVHARRKMEGLAYVDLGPDNGAILIDLGEGGLCFHSVAPVSLDQAVLLKFKLPGSTGFIEGYAEVAWLNESGKGGGLRFVELKSELREQIGAWARTVRAAEVGMTEGSATQVSATQVSSEVQRSVEAAGAEAENASAKGETTVEPEPAHAPVDLAPEPVSDGASAGISEDVADVDRGVITIRETETEGALPSVEPSEEQAIAAASTAPLAENSEPIAPSGSSLITKKPAGYYSAPPPARPSEGAEVVKKAGEPAAGKPSRAAGNAPAKAHPAAGVPSDGIPSRVHSGIMAASASESSAPASRVAPSAGSAAASGEPRAKHMSPSRAASSVSSQSRDKVTATQPRTPLAVTNGEGAHRIAPFARRSQVPARRRDEWEGQGEELLLKIEETPASQALKIGIGAAAGAILVLAIVAAVPSLRTRVLATTNAKSAATPLAPGFHEFQVEVADMNNRRWMLKSGGIAGSPFIDTTTRRNTQPAAAPARKNAAKPEPPGESNNAIEAPAPEIQQPKTASPAELVLARPLKGAPVGSQVQNLPPSIFDGITPPIGSLADSLPVTGPNAPGPVPVQAGVPGGDLHAAVLLDRVAPVYPMAALKDGIRGEVRVKATIGKDGVPTNLKAVSGDPRLIQAALEAIRKWRYRPATLEGQPIETTTTVSVAFQVN